jgi:streptomycin 6-kinase
VSDGVDLTATEAEARRVAAEWGVELGPPFALSRFSYVAPATGGAVLKVAWEGDEESLHEAEALELWDGDGAVRLLRRDGRALLLERAEPGTDVADLDDDEAMPLAAELGTRLWRRAGAPFRLVNEHVERWLDNAECWGEPCFAVLGDAARRLLAELSQGDWLVHGDFHHHNVLRSARGPVAIDPKPYLADREYDVYPWLHNPLPYELTDVARTERRIAAFAAAGLDEGRIRAWAVIRGAYLIGDEEPARVLRSLV